MLGWFKKKRKEKPAPDPVESGVPQVDRETAEEENRGGEKSPGESAATIQPPVTKTDSQEDEAVDPYPAGGIEAAEGGTLDRETEKAEPPEPKEASVDITEAGGEPADTEQTAQHDKQSAPAPEKTPSLFKKLSDRLSKTRESFTHRIDELFLGKKQIDGDLFDDLEELLVTADLGISTTQELLESARRRVKRDALSDPQILKNIIKEKIKAIIVDHDQPGEIVLPEEGPFVIMVIGVNGVGKTTTIGKIARKFQNSGQSVLLVAADTFRAAAVSQLKIWGERNSVRVVSQQEGADPSSVVYDAMAVAVNKEYDVVLVDTAGRLHTRANLMEELKKIKRVMDKQLAGAPHEVLLVIDATTGQNGISQALLFNEAVGVTGIALTKLDGTAKGGIVANIAKELKTPIRFIGVGEQIDDLRDFDADEFIEALFES